MRFGFHNNKIDQPKETPEAEKQPEQVEEVPGKPEQAKQPEQVKEATGEPEQIRETSENQEPDQELPKQPESEETYDDCQKETKEVSEDPDIAVKESSEDEETMDDYDDCGLEQDGVEKKSSETDEETDEDTESDDFEDCGAGDNGGAAVELKEEETEETKEQLEEAAQEVAEEKEEEVDEQEEECEEQTEETKEQLEEAAGDDTGHLEGEQEEQELDADELDEEAMAENTAEAIEEETREELSDEEKQEVQEELAEEVEARAENGEIEAGEVEEAAQEVVEEKEEEAEEREEQEEETKEQLEETAGDDVGHLEAEQEEQELDADKLDEEAMAENTAEAIEEETGEELSDEEKQEVQEELAGDIETRAENGEIEAGEVEEVAQEAAEEKEEELEEKEEEIEEEKEEQEEIQEQEEEAMEEEKASYEERLEKVMDSEEASYSESVELKEESQKYLEELEAKQGELEAASKEKFEEVMKLERGTEEYKAALREYNETQEKREQLETELSDRKEQQELLEKRSVELRQQQIEKGEEAILDSKETLDEASGLQEQYEEEYYRKKPDEGKLNEIQEQNSETIRELSAQKDSIKLAMDAKMAEISEYVASRNMERYDTERDPYYQNLIAQYRSMQDSYRKIDYNIAKLDENSICIAEISGKPYESVQRSRKMALNPAAAGKQTGEGFTVHDRKVQPVSVENMEVQDGDGNKIDPKTIETASGIYTLLPASAITGVDSTQEQFWNHHANSRDDYLKLAQKLPEVQRQLQNGVSIEELRQDSSLQSCVDAFFSDKKMIRVLQTENGFEFEDDGRHRVAAARELDLDIPVKILDCRKPAGDGDKEGYLESEISGEKERSKKFREQYRVKVSETFPKKKPQEGTEDTSIGEREREIEYRESFMDRARKAFRDGTSEGKESVFPKKVPPVDDAGRSVWKPEALPGKEAVEPQVDIVPLMDTKQEVVTVEYTDGSRATRFDHPEELSRSLPYSQGNNELGKKGTCALACTGSWLRVAKSRNTENDVVNYASTHKGMDGEPLCSESGGTRPSDIPVIWEQFGMPAECDPSKNIERIAEAVENGRAVSVGVNAGILWGMDNPEGFDTISYVRDGGANHAIGIMSCERDAVTGNITHFYINDTGRGLKRDACRKISIHDFIKAFCVNRAKATISKRPVW